MKPAERTELYKLLENFAYAVRDEVRGSNGEVYFNFSDKAVSRAPSDVHFLLGEVMEFVDGAIDTAFGRGYNEGSSEGYDSGYEEGFDAGYAAGLQENS